MQFIFVNKLKAKYFDQSYMNIYMYIYIFSL